MKKNFICSTGLSWLWLAVIVLIIDLISKQLIINNFKLHESIQLIPCFNLVHVQNSGIAFSLLANKDWRLRWVFTFIAIIICIWLVIIMYHQSMNKKLSNISYALVVGGALGNLYDRLVYGFVIDFINFYVGDFEWPIFNIADMAIFIGVIFNITDNLINTDKKYN